MSDQVGDNGKMLELYQRFMTSAVAKDYYENSNFNNFGLWEDDVKTQKEACLKLIKKLSEGLNEPNGKILDIACGTGGSTAYLQDRFSNSRVTGINISDKQIGVCRENYPTIDFITMDATNLRFADESFDVVFCIESATHFNTRADFISESFRVLKPGGVLIISDVLMDLVDGLDWFAPFANSERSIAAYETLLKRYGFLIRSIEDKKQTTLLPYIEHLRKWALKKEFLNLISREDCQYLISLTDLLNQLPINHYLLVSAQKPRKQIGH